MNRTYDIFEKKPDGALVWRAAVVGHEEAIRKLKEISAGSSSEFQLMHVPTKSLIAATNVRSEAGT